jgi:group I intron endonuclease
MASGIYKITNTINGHCYVGSAVDIQHRWRTHKSNLILNKNRSRYLQSAWNKYGQDAFEFSVIEACSVLELIFREQHWINTLKPEYNLAPNAGNSLGVKHTPEYKAKISAFLTGNKRNAGRKASLETRKKLSEAHKGKKISSEHREKLIQANTGRVVTDATREKIRVANAGRVHTPEERAKISASRTPEYRAKMSETIKATMTPEHRAKLSESHKASMTPDLRARLSKANKGKGRKHTPETKSRLSAIVAAWWKKKKESI